MITTMNSNTHDVARNPFIRLDLQDNVVVARMEVPAGTTVPSEGLVTAALLVHIGHHAIDIRKVNHALMP